MTKAGPRPSLIRYILLVDSHMGENMICEVAKFLLITSILFITVSSLKNMPTGMVFAQSSQDTYMQQNIEKYQELGEKGFIKDCMSTPPKEIFTKDTCQILRDTVKEKMMSQQENQTANATSTSQGYEVYNDISGGYSVRYPSDWHVRGGNIIKGTREFSVNAFSDPKFSILDTSNFGATMHDLYKDDGVKFTGNLGEIQIDGEPARTFSYSEDNKETMVAAIMHNNTGYLFKYETLKENFDSDTDTMIQFLSSIKFLDK
jgi:hypothetical protein